MPLPMFVRGTDPTVPRFWQRSDTRRDPSGFAPNGITDEDVRLLIDMGRRTLTQLCDEAPGLLVDRLPATIPFYGKPPQVLRASTVLTHAQQPGDFDAQPNGQFVPRTIGIPEVMGIALACTHQDLHAEMADVEEAIRHELIHVLTRGVASTMPVEEAVVEKLNGPAGSCRTTTTRTIPWDADHFSATSGLNTEHFVGFAQSRGSSLIASITGVTHFRRQTTQQVWKLCETILARPQGERRCIATPEEFDAASREVFGEEETNQLQESIVMRPLHPGRQCFLLPVEKSMAFALSLDVAPNPHFLQKRGSIDLQKYIVQDHNPTTLSLRYTVDGFDRTFAATVPYDQRQVIRFDDLVQLLLQHTPLSPSSTIRRIECQAGDAHCTLLPPAENRSAPRAAPDTRG